MKKKDEDFDVNHKISMQKNIKSKTKEEKEEKQL